MGEESVDISVIEYFKTGQSLDKKNKRKILDFFKFLGGGESPTEAVELTVRRNWNLREAQLKAVYEMVKLVENPPSLVSFERKIFPDFLSLEVIYIIYFLCDTWRWTSEFLEIYDFPKFKYNLMEGAILMNNTSVNSLRNV